MSFFQRKQKPADPLPALSPALHAFAAAVAPKESPLADMTRDYISRFSSSDLGVLPLPADPVERMVEIRLRLAERDNRPQKRKP